MDSINGYLSRVAQTTWPRGLVIVKGGDDHIEIIFLRRPDAEDIGLGSSVGEAHQSLRALMRATGADGVNDD